jgi:uncharacterized membrane protein YhhN
MSPARFAPPLFIGLALVYWLSLWSDGFAGDWAVKAAPMLLAAGVLATTLPSRFGLPMAIGFTAAAAGDVLLALDRQQHLAQALLCFLVTQVAYSIAFVARQRPLGDRLEYRLPIAVYGAVLLAMMLPTLGPMLVPVFVYVVALIAMAVLSAGVESVPGRVYFGACLFVIADSLIGIDRFIVPIAAAELVIVAIYAVGQFLIFTGMLEVGRSGVAADRGSMA